MILADLRSSMAKCVLCAWFNEWHRFGERDQLSLSYVLHAMHLTPPPEPTGSSTSRDLVRDGRGRKRGRRAAPPHRGVYLWPRHDHWHYKRDKKAGEPKRRPFVRYVGHGGCAEGPDANPKKNKAIPGCHGRTVSRRRPSGKA